jgi:hypothetical protein
LSDLIIDWRNYVFDLLRSFILNRVIQWLYRVIHWRLYGVSNLIIKSVDWFVLVGLCIIIKRRRSIVYRWWVVIDLIFNGWVVYHRGLVIV